MTIGRFHAVLSGFVLLIAWGLAVRLVPSLKYLPYAFSSGFVIAILLVGLVIATTSRPIVRPHGITQTPKWVTPLLEDSHGFPTESTLISAKPVLISDSISELIGEIIDLILANLVSSWYTAISTSSAFVASIDINLRFALQQLLLRVEQEDFVGLVVSKIVPIITSHLREVDNAEKACKARVLSKGLSEFAITELMLAREYQNGRIHPAVTLADTDDGKMRQNYLRKVVSNVLPEILDTSIKESRSTMILIREIVTCALATPILQLCADPDTWNQLVSTYGAETIQDRKSVKRMRAALDEHTPAPISGSRLELPTLQPHDTERMFEKYVRTIRRTKTLDDARRFRSQVANQLSKDKAIEGQDPLYIKRLEMCKRVLDQKIGKLSAASDSPRIGPDSTLSSDQARVITPGTPALSDIMHTTIGLSNLMEFAHRYEKTSLVQFWTVVDGFRNPLEDDFGEDRAAISLTWTNADRLVVARIAEVYLSNPDIGFSAEAQKVVQDFLTAGRHATPQHYRAARIAILSTQSAVLESLEQSLYPDFRRSDLYRSFLGSEEGRKLFAEKAKPESASVQALKAVRARPVTRVAMISRTSSQPASTKHTDLRKAVLSSTDLQRMAKTDMAESNGFERRSLDLDRDRRPLFADEDEQDLLAASIQSLDEEDFQNEAEAVESMEAAMFNIIAGEPVRSISEDDFDVLESPSVEFKDRPPMRSGQTSPRLSRHDLIGSHPSKPNLASLGLVNPAGRIGVFQDNDLFGDEQHLTEDEYVDREEDEDKADETSVVEAAPGDLGLRETITTLSNEIERLVSQESVVDVLTRKAELTNNTVELRILGKSKSSLQREIRRKEMQRQQYIVQESDNSLFGRANVRIKSIMVGREDDGSEYALYLVEVQRRAGESMPSATWTVTHRYSEFHDLHQKLRRRYPSTRGLEFPRRRMVMKLQKQFLHNRKIALEAYLQQLLQMPDVCASRELRSFLSQHAITPILHSNAADAEAANSQDIVARIYNSVTDGMDEFLGNIAVLDQLSTAGQNLITAAQSQLNSNNHKPQRPGTLVQRDSEEVIITQPNSIAEAEAELRAFEDQQLEPFIKSICDLFLETFELNRGSNWLRGRAVVVVLHQLLGGTIERKVRDSFRSLFVESALVRYLSLARDTLFPYTKAMDMVTGVEIEQRRMRPSPSERTKQEKERSKQEATIVLTTLLPELAGSIVGRANAKIASKRLLAMMNNKKLNEHLIYTILDVVVAALFEDKYKNGVSRKKRYYGETQS